MTTLDFAVAQAPARAPRSDRGTVRMTDRDIRALLWIGEQYAVQVDHLSTLLGVSEESVRQLLVRWRRAELVQTARLGLGAQWVWLTRTGLQWTGLPYTYTPPALARLAHYRAVNAVRLGVQFDGDPEWRSERALRHALGGSKKNEHAADAELLYADGRVAAVEVELSAKAKARIDTVLRTLAGRTTDYGREKDALQGAPPRYGRVFYLTTNETRTVVEQAVLRAFNDPAARSRFIINPLPAGWSLPPLTGVRRGAA